MGDVFFENSIKRRLSGPQRVLPGVVIFFTVLFFIILTLTGNLLYLISFVLFLALSIFFVINSNIEFDYSLVNNELEITRITNKSRRKVLINTDIRENLVVMAPPGDASINKYEREPIKKLDCTAHDGEKYYELVVRKGADDGEIMILFSPDEKMAEAIQRLQPRSVKIS